jgi:hypothetical protein
MNMRLFVRRSDAAGKVDVARLETQVADFGHAPAHNPVRNEIARLRRERDAGAMTETDFATRVAELLGAVDPAALASR